MKRRASIPGRINIIGEHTDYAGGVRLHSHPNIGWCLKQNLLRTAIMGTNGRSTVERSRRTSCTVGSYKFNSDWKRDVIIGGTLLSIVLCVHGQASRQAACEEAQRLEHVVLGTPCGLLDQMTMMHALEGKCVLIDFSTKTTTTMSIPSDWTFKLVDSGIHRTLNSKDYRTTSTEETKRLHVESENRRVEEAMNSDSEALGNSSMKRMNH